MDITIIPDGLTRHVAQSVRHCDRAQAHTQPSTRHPPVSQQLRDDSVDRGVRDGEHFSRRTERRHAQQGAARIEHCSTFLGAAESNIKGDALFDAPAGAAAPLRADRIDDAETRRDGPVDVCAQSERKRAWRARRP